MASGSRAWIAATPVVDTKLPFVRPFTYESPSDYRPHGPYALTGKRYAEDLAEVQSIGRIRHDDANGSGYQRKAGEDIPQKPYRVSRMRFFEDLNRTASRKLARERMALLRGNNSTVGD